MTAAPALRSISKVPNIFTEQESQVRSISRLAFRRGMVIETSGPRDEVIKCLCPLVIDDDEQQRGRDILGGGVADWMRNDQRRIKPADRSAS